MSTVQEIESAIKRLDDGSLGRLSEWFEDYLAEKWEQRFEADVRAGKLDKLGQEADRAFAKASAGLYEALHDTRFLGPFQSLASRSPGDSPQRFRIA